MDFRLLLLLCMLVLVLEFIVKVTVTLVEALLVCWYWCSFLGALLIHTLLFFFLLLLLLATNPTHHTIQQHANTLLLSFFFLFNRPDSLPQHRVCFYYYIFSIHFVTYFAPKRTRIFVRSSVFFLLI